MFPKTLANYKNPCWHEESVSTRSVLTKCLPYFLVAGFADCGTSELYEKLQLHPQVVGSNLEEPAWLGKRGRGSARVVYRGIGNERGLLKHVCMWKRNIELVLLYNALYAVLLSLDKCFEHKLMVKL